MTTFESSSNLISRLHAVLTRQRLVLFVAGLITTAAVVALVWIGLSVLAHIMVLPVWLKISLMALSSVAAGFLFVRFALSRLFGGSVDSVAVRLEQRHPELKGRLIAAVQFARTGRQQGYSDELVAMTEQQALKQAGLYNFNEIVTFNPVVRTTRYLLVSMVLGALLLVAFPGFFSYSYEVYSNPTVEIAPPLAYDIVAVPGSTEWVKYRDIEIGAAVIGLQIPDRAVIHHRLAGGNWQSSEIDLNRIRSTAIDRGDSLSFGMTLRQINKSFDYYVVAGRVQTDVYHVDVVDRPRVTSIHLEVFYPDYTGLQPQVTDENNGSFSAVVGSRANLKIGTNLPVESAELVFDDSSRTPLKLGVSDGSKRTAETALVVEKSRSYHIELRDHLGEENPDPIEYYLTAVPDEYPSVNIVRPGFNVNLSDDMMLPLKARIFDDYGFSSLVLKYTLVAQGQPSEEHVAVLNFSDRIKTEGDIEFNWDLDKLRMYPGDWVKYHFEVADNDRISGPKVSKSREYIARLPSLDEIIANAETETGEQIVRSEDLMRQGRDLSERLKNVARKLNSQARQSNEAGEWEQQKELENIAGKNQEMIKRVEELAQRMENSLESMKENALLSREIMERLEQIQKLYEEVATPEMKAAQKRLMEALKSMNQQELQQAMKDFQMSQDELLQRLDRTLSLLKKMQVAQKMESMIRRAEELVKRQDDMNSKTEKSPEPSLPKLSSSEDQIRKDLESLQKEVADLKKLMKEAEMDDIKEAQKFAEAVQKSDAGQDMQQMSNSLSQQQKQSASKKGDQALSKLTKMLDEMQQQQMAMQGADADKIKQAMRRAMDDANYLSRSQEDLLKKAVEIDPRSALVHDMAAQQQDLKSACTGLRATIAELGKASPFIAAELQMLVNDATEAMDLSVTGLGERRAGAAHGYQRDAMVDLNKASVRLMESLEQMKQCDNASSCSKPMQKLQSMCNKQNKLNQQTQKMCNNPGESGSGEQAQKARQGLQRLAAEQGSLRKSMQQLAQEFGNSRQILGRLDDIAREMQGVEEDLADGEAGPETTERQLRIYSRMLEASRSLQRKDFSEQRQAQTAETEAFVLPPNLPAELLNDQTNIENRLRDFFDAEYPSQYEEQIKAYFRALLKAEDEAPASSGSGNE